MVPKWVGQSLRFPEWEGHGHERTDCSKKVEPRKENTNADEVRHGGEA